MKNQHGKIGTVALAVLIGLFALLSTGSSEKRDGQSQEAVSVDRTYGLCPA